MLEGKELNYVHNYLRGWIDLSIFKPLKREEIIAYSNTFQSELDPLMTELQELKAALLDATSNSKEFGDEDGTLERTEVVLYQISEHIYNLLGMVKHEVYAELSPIELLAILREAIYQSRRTANAYKQYNKYCEHSRFHAEDKHLNDRVTYPSFESIHFDKNYMNSLRVSKIMNGIIELDCIDPQATENLQIFYKTMDTSIPSYINELNNSTGIFFACVQGKVTVKRINKFDLCYFDTNLYNIDRCIISLLSLISLDYLVKGNEEKMISSLGKCLRCRHVTLSFFKPVYNMFYGAE